MKYLFVQEYLRVNHTIQHKDGTMTIDFGQSSSGKNLKSKLRKHGIDTKDVGFAYMYPRVPEVEQTNKQGTPTKYKDVTAKQAKPFQEELNKLIVEEKPEVVIPNGKLGSKYFTDATAITKTRGIPLKTSVTYNEQEHEFWVLPMFSIEYTTVKPSNEAALEADLNFLARYDKQGEEVFIPDYVEYDTLTQYDDVVALFNRLWQDKTVTAFDLETNTLQPERDGAKVLTVALTNKEGEGYTIPIDHKDFTWEDEERDSILKLLRNLLAEPSIPKVGHNVKYDVRVLMSIFGFTDFESVYDTQIGYWMTVTQEKNISFRLSDLAFEYTNIGGYDDKLEQWKKDYIRNYRDPETQKKVKPVNEVDGSDFNYEWIPFDMLTYYAGGDVDATLRIHNALWENIQKSDKWVDLYTSFYPRLTRSLARMESNGLHVDTEYAKVLQEAYSKEEERLLEDIRSLPSVQEVSERKQALYEAGVDEFANNKPADRDPEIVKFRTRYKDPEKRKFNPNSSDDKGEVLFDILGIELPLDKEFIKDSAMKRRPQSNGDLDWIDYSTGKAALEEIISGDYVEEAKIVASKLQEYSKVSKLKTSFVDNVERDTADDGAIHGNFNPTGTACVAGDTLVATDKGLIPIETLSDNRVPNTFSDINVNVYGIEGEATAKYFYYSGVSEGIKITLENGLEITTTPNHPLWVNDYLSSGKTATHTKDYKERQRHKNAWVQAEDITLGDYIVVKYKHSPKDLISPTGEYIGVLEEDLEQLFVKVTNIEAVGETEFFDLNVPETHSFVANGIMNHNTSRLSSSNPNLQNVPSSHSNVDKFDYHYPIKRMYKSRFENGLMLEADYSALEMRILGLVAEDEEMTKTFLDGRDIHKNTASIINDISEEEVTDDQRQASKAIAFG